MFKMMRWPMGVILRTVNPTDTEVAVNLPMDAVIEQVTSEEGQVPVLHLRVPVSVTPSPDTFEERVFVTRVPGIKISDEHDYLGRLRIGQQDVYLFEQHAPVLAGGVDTAVASIDAAAAGKRAGQHGVMRTPRSRPRV